MIFRTIEKINRRILPKYPDKDEFCCSDLEKAFLNQQISITLGDSLRCVINLSNPNSISINYCPFCGKYFEFEEMK